MVLRACGEAVMKLDLDTIIATLEVIAWICLLAVVGNSVMWWW